MRNKLFKKRKLKSKNIRKKNCVCDQLKSRVGSNVILTTKENTLFYAFGDLLSDTCFTTVFFKVIKVDCCKNCIELALLRPDVDFDTGDNCCVPLSVVCDVMGVDETTNIVHVDCDCLCSFQTL